MQDEAVREVCENFQYLDMGIFVHILSGRINPNGIIDENYNIREFTPIEVERLQTVPDNYTLIDGIKKKERYEALGNGWTVDVIAHIFSFMK